MNEIDISRVVDQSRLRRFHIWLAFWCLLAMAADGFDLVNASIAGPALIRQWGVSKADLGPIFSASLVGFFIGAPFFGFLGDRYGRRIAIITGLLCVGVATFASAFATDVPQLLWLRLASGLGLGGVIPNVIALNAEFAPKRLRATMMVVMSVGISLGASVPGVVGATLMPRYGWPIIFLIGGAIPFAIGLCLPFAIPESIKFLVLRGHRPERVASLLRRIDPSLQVTPQTRFVLNQDEGSSATKGSPRALFRGGWAPVTILVWLVFVLNLAANNMMNAWLPMIVQSSGHGEAAGAYAGTLYQLGGSAGGLVIGVLIDRVGLRIMALLFALAVPVVAFTGTPGLSASLLLTMAFFTGCVVTGMQNGLNAGAGEIYPTALRSNGVGYCLGVGRIGSVGGPLIGSLLVSLHMQTSSFFYITAVGPFLCAILWFVLMRQLSQVRRIRVEQAAA